MPAANAKIRKGVITLIDGKDNQYFKSSMFVSSPIKQEEVEE
jgi:hypothetical protein